MGSLIFKLKSAVTSRITRKTKRVKVPQVLFLFISAIKSNFPTTLGSRQVVTCGFAKGAVGGGGKSARVGS